MTHRVDTVFLCMAGILSGCIGTDFLDEKPGDPMLEIGPGTGAVIIAQSIQFDADYRDGFDRVVDSALVVWTSSDESIATIGSNGIATGLTVGETMILGEVDGTLSQPAFLNVVADATTVARVEISKQTLMLSAGSSETLMATAFNVVDGVINPGTLSWSSSDPSIATVDANGLVTAIATGVALITVTADGVSSAPTTVTVPGRTKEGSFAPAPGSSYTVAGTARLVESATGNLTIEFDSNFIVSDGPDIQVYVSSTSNVTSSSTNLGLVKGRTGAQQYSVPFFVDFSSANYIIIHCVSFNVTFGQAEIN